MTNGTKCKIIIDSNSRFSPIGCPNCSATVWSTGMTEEETKSGLTYDEDDHFNGKPYFAYLPHDQYSWNRFDADIIDNTIYYNGNMVVKLDDIQEFYKGIEEDKYEEEPEPEEEYKPGPCEVKSELGDLTKYIRYYLFIDNGDDSEEDSEDDNEIVELEDSEDGTKIENNGTKYKKMTWYFDGIPMTNCHIHVIMPV
jgi:hypothetical protein